MAMSNIGRFMKKHGISNWCQLVEKANNDIEGYWNAVNEDLGIEWFRKYDKTYDSLAGIPWTKWFLNGKCNIVVNAIDRHAKSSRIKSPTFLQMSKVQGKSLIMSLTSK